MENLTNQSSMTKSEWNRRRMEEIENTLGGMSLGDTKDSSTIKQSIPANLDQNPIRNRANHQGSRGIAFENKSSIEAQMGRMNEPVTLAGYFFPNHLSMNINNDLNSEFEKYMKEMNDRGDYLDVEVKDCDKEYWDQIHQSFNRRQTNTNPAYP